MRAKELLAVRTHDCSRAQVELDKHLDAAHVALDDFLVFPGSAWVDTINPKLTNPTESNDRIELTVTLDMLRYFYVAMQFYPEDQIAELLQKSIKTGLEKVLIECDERFKTEARNNEGLIAFVERKVSVSERQWVITGPEDIISLFSSMTGTELNSESTAQEASVIQLIFPEDWEQKFNKTKEYLDYCYQSSEVFPFQTVGSDELSEVMMFLVKQYQLKSPCDSTAFLRDLAEEKLVIDLFHAVKNDSEILAEFCGSNLWKDARALRALLQSVTNAGDQGLLEAHLLAMFARAAESNCTKVVNAAGAVEKKEEAKNSWYAILRQAHNAVAESIATRSAISDALELSQKRSELVVVEAALKAFKEDLIRPTDQLNESMGLLQQLQIIVKQLHSTYRSAGLIAAAVAIGLPAIGIGVSATVGAAATGWTAAGAIAGIVALSAMPFLGIGFAVVGVALIVAFLVLGIMSVIAKNKAQKAKQPLSTFPGEKVNLKDVVAKVTETQGRVNRKQSEITGKQEEVDAKKQEIADLSGDHEDAAGPNAG